MGGVVMEDTKLRNDGYISLETAKQLSIARIREVIAKDKMNDVMHTKRTISYEGYLDEIKLGQCLAEIFPDYEFIHDKAVPGAGISNRPDYRCEALKLIVEFDGYQHYCQVDVMYKDRQKDAIYAKMGYRIVRIPYFVQLTTDVVAHYFGATDVDMQVDFPQGFIADKGEKLPAEFCTLGIARFVDELQELQFIQDDIIRSLKAKVEKYEGDMARVLPLDVAHCSNALLKLIETN